MQPASYAQLATHWQPGQNNSRVFYILATLLVLLALAAGMVLSRMPLPEQPDAGPTKVPERVARFIAQKEQPPPPPPPPPPRAQPKPAEPTPRPEAPRVVRPREEPKREPLTDSQARAREKAATTGLLALSNELSELRDTSAVSAQVNRNLRSRDGDRQAASHNAERLTQNIERGSDGVDASQYATVAGSSELAAHDSAEVDAALAARAGADGPAGDAGARNDRARSQEEITLVIDRHKSQLQSLYNRARRSNASLRGKLVLAITIAPDGRVTQVEVVSSELNDKALEASLAARVRSFQFGAKDVQTVTVNYPIEFLP